MARRVVFAGFMHETNTFAPTLADYAAFEQGGGYMPMVRGAAMLQNSRGLNLGISGALDHAAAAGWQILPLLWTGAIPSAPVTRDAYDKISSEILSLLEAQLAQGPLDGVFLDLHGAMVAEHIADGEGWLLAAVRQLIGAETPLVAALDLHGNITRQMVDAADVLVGFRTYPHIDMAETGRRAAKQLELLMAGERPKKAFRQLDYLIPISWQATAAEPAKSLYNLTAALETGEVVSTSLFMGFPAADFVDCGPSVVAYGKTQQAADAAATKIANAVSEAEPAFHGKVFTPEEAVTHAMQIAADAVGRPVVIADTQDNPGAGGDSNTTGMLRALVALDARSAAIGLMVDPAAAAAAHMAGEGAVTKIRLAGSGLPDDLPFEGVFTVEKLSDGKLQTKGPYYGNAPLNLGASATLRIGDVRVVVTSHKAQMADREMFRFAGIEPEQQAILVVKSSVHFRADFEPIAHSILVAAAPGPMPVSPASLPWQHLRQDMRIEPTGKPFIKANSQTTEAEAQAG